MAIIIDGLDIDTMSVQDLSNKKVIKEVFNIYSDELELNNACNKILARAKSFGSEELVDLVKSYICEFLERRRKKQELIEERNKRLEWHMEVRRKKEKEEEKKRIKKRKKELDRLQLEDLKEQREKESLERKRGLVGSLDLTPEEIDNLINNELVFKKDGTLDVKNVSNYDLIIQNDKFIKEHVRFNEFTNNLEFDGNNFRNVDLLDIVSYMARSYRLQDKNIIWDALNRSGNVIKYHPVKDIIEEEEWDGTPRIDEFFQNITNTVITDDNSRLYYREVARMLFFGGIKRLYEPGSKFDYMIIFKGNQGTCKTTLVRMLALDDDAYSEVTTIDGSEGIENIKGSWICEFAELLAMVRAREVESIKAFITRQYDKYRPPYAHVSEIVPRSCIFIGTTNDIQFMSDMTGNRRYLPVEINTNPVEFFAHEEDIEKYILECWREAFYKYLNNENGDFYTTISAEYFKILEDMRVAYIDDNPIEGLIRGYLSSLPVGYEICGLEIFTKCMNGLRSKFTAHDSRSIATIMNKIHNWVRCNDRKSFTEQGYGQQRYWKKVSDDE